MLFIILLIYNILLLLFIISYNVIYNFNVISLTLQVVANASTTLFARDADR